MTDRDSDTVFPRNKLIPRIYLSIIISFYKCTCCDFQARESPEATFDISGCEISDIPSGVYSLCKVLQKEVCFKSPKLQVHNMSSCPHN